MSYGTDFIDDPKLNKPERVGKGIKMSKQNKSTEPNKPAKKAYTPTRMEVVKTVIIAVLITAVVAFICGMNFQKSHDMEVKNAVSQATATAQAANVKK